MNNYIEVKKNKNYIEYFNPNLNIMEERLLSYMNLIISINLKKLKNDVFLKEQFFYSNEFINKFDIEYKSTHINNFINNLKNKILYKKEKNTDY